MFFLSSKSDRLYKFLLHNCDDICCVQLQSERREGCKLIRNSSSYSYTLAKQRLPGNCIQELKHSAKISKYVPGYVTG